MVQQSNFTTSTSCGCPTCGRDQCAVREACDGLWRDRQPVHCRRISNAFFHQAKPPAGLPSRRSGCWKTFEKHDIPGPNTSPKGGGRSPGAQRPATGWGPEPQDGLRLAPTGTACSPTGEGVSRLFVQPRPRERKPGRVTRKLTAALLLGVALPAIALPGFANAQTAPTTVGDARRRASSTGWDTHSTATVG